jgi:diguanylate cyclase (GGDEF)-like protein/PAS domain S-box-containing protein
METTGDHYRLLIEQSSDVVFTIDADGAFDWVSPTSLRVTGWAPEELIGRQALDVVPPSGHEEMEAMAQALARGETVHYEGLLGRADGSLRWTAVTVRPISGDGVGLLGAVGSARDVHDEVLARLALAESEAHYQLLAEHASDIVVRMDTHRCISWVSPAVTPLLGWSPSELIGKPGVDLIHPADVAALQSLRDRTYDVSRPTPPTGPVLVRLLQQQGGYRWMSDRQSVITDENGNLTAVINSLTDVEDLVRAQESAQRDRERLRRTIDTLHDPHVLLEPVRDADCRTIDLVYVEANEAACSYNKVSHEELIGNTVRTIVPGTPGVQLVALFAEALASGDPLVIDEMVFEDPIREVRGRRFELRAAKVGDAISVTWREVTDRYVHEEQLAHRATHDPLTGLSNRAALLDELNRALHAGHRSGRSTAVLMFDLDHFKYVNDAMGHAVGDELLGAAARRLESAVRAGDLVGRLGGDEFVVVMRDLDESDEALRTGIRIVESFRAPLLADGHDLLATASLGIALSTDTSTAEQLMREADVAMYRSKEAGRDRVSMFNEALREAADARMVMEQELRPALDLGELVVFFQPEVDLQTGRVCGAEALVRWEHRSGELYAADRFIDLAEETGLIVDIGRWVIRKSCRQLVRWTTSHPGRLSTLYLNLSKGQLSDPALVADFKSIIIDTGVDPSMLCVEIGETGLAHATATVNNNLARLRELGLRLAIDDFGSGDAALAHLREHRVDTVKVDRTFVRDVESNDYARRLVGGIAALAQRVGLRVVAGGVETEHQAEFLREMGIFSAHGYLFSGAVPADEFDLLMDRTFKSGDPVDFV